MRSAVVVLPASMCAMIPMLRVFSRGKVRGMFFFCVECGLVGDLERNGLRGHPALEHEKGPCGPGVTGSPRNRVRRLCEGAIHCASQLSELRGRGFSLLPERRAMIAEV